MNVTLRTCALVFFVRGDFPRALNFLNLDRETETGKAFRLDMLVRQGSVQEALAIGVPNVPQWTAKYTMLLACARGAAPSEVASWARDIRPAADSEENYLSAAHLSYCGETEAAAAMLKRAIDGNYCSYPAMDSIRSSRTCARDPSTVRSSRGRVVSGEIPHRASPTPALGRAGRLVPFFFQH